MWAYGNWTSNGITGCQAYLNRLGFELVHSYHPVSGKNSADIQMTVDAIEYAWNLERMSWFVFATGGSDVSPLFRRLREMGKGVVGVGPRSTLSETVKTSCSRFIYTESVTQKGDTAVQSAYEDAVDIAEKVMSNFEDAVHLSTLKAKMLNIDSAFDEKQLGFSSFSSFIETIENLSVSQQSTMCEVLSPAESKTEIAESTDLTQLKLLDIYTSMLRRKNWRILPKEDLISIFNQIDQRKLLTKEQLLSTVLDNIGQKNTPTNVRKAFAIFIKSNVLKKIGTDLKGQDVLWGTGDKPVAAAGMLAARDIAIVSRVLTACEEEKIPFQKKQVQKLLYSDHSVETIDSIIASASNMQGQISF